MDSGSPAFAYGSSVALASEQSQGLSFMPMLGAESVSPYDSTNELWDPLVDCEIHIEYCSRATFHTKHDTEKYEQYFYEIQALFKDRHPSVQVIANCPKRGAAQRSKAKNKDPRGRSPHRIFTVHDHLLPIEDLSWPRLGSFEVTLVSSTVPETVIWSKLWTGKWPSPSNIIMRTEEILKLPKHVGQPRFILPSPQSSTQHFQWSGKGEPVVTFPGRRAVKAKRNPIAQLGGWERSWVQRHAQPQGKPPTENKNVKEFSKRLYGHIENMKNPPSDTYADPAYDEEPWVAEAAQQDEDLATRIERLALATSGYLRDPAAEESTSTDIDVGADIDLHSSWRGDDLEGFHQVFGDMDEAIFPEDMMPDFAQPVHGATFETVEEDPAENDVDSTLPSANPGASRASDATAGGVPQSGQASASADSEAAFVAASGSQAFPPAAPDSHQLGFPPPNQLPLENSNNNNTNANYSNSNSNNIQYSATTLLQPGVTEGQQGPSSFDATTAGGTEGLPATSGSDSPESGYSFEVGGSEAAAAPEAASRTTTAPNRAYSDAFESSQGDSSQFGGHRTELPLPVQTAGSEDQRPMSTSAEEARAVLAACISAASRQHEP
eukprot:CAMPEP_0206435790 /NCGR_PEP_ID=MMETSP0324_2-20121206/10095_1 /ASSEMBLY_ACC=CAM_ASM_000836 /TAXON_ID=2866 /ORGANISM="Crypthecodinium cohnii, Strain Seligo" /LENGTH=606 /DNA_ID=CAMNT_0053902827 /DNA_START=78 /DNA_END=1898 /DNA_ORIENTATION=+